MVEVIAFANATSSALRAAGSFAGLLASVGTGSGDVHNRYFYDGRGLLQYTLDNNLRPTQYVYDAAGNLIHTFDYGASIASTSAYSASYVASQISSLGLVSTADT